MTLNRLRRRLHPAWRWPMLAVGLLIIALGYHTLAIAPDTAEVDASRQAFLGMGLVIAGSVVALVSRVL